MFNHATYESCLFFTSGNVEYRNRTTDLDKLGGLAKFMPLTYISALIACLSVSGVPPFNGFFSKWMIYQGVVADLSATKIVGVVCLAMALFGSGLTLANCMRLLHAVYLGQPAKETSEAKVKEAPLSMTFPMMVLAALCVIFGIFAYQWPLKHFIYPAVSSVAPPDIFIMGISSLLVLSGIIFGLAFYYFRKVKIKARQDTSFIGGESVPMEAKVSGVEFYNTIREFGLLKAIYKKAEAGVFDIYEQGKKIFAVSHFLSFLHNGVLPRYLAWMLLAILALFLLWR